VWFAFAFVFVDLLPKVCRSEKQTELRCVSILLRPPPRRALATLSSILSSTVLRPRKKERELEQKEEKRKKKEKEREEKLTDRCTET